MDISAYALRGCSRQMDRASVQIYDCSASNNVSISLQIALKIKCGKISSECVCLEENRQSADIVEIIYNKLDSIYL